MSKRRLTQLLRQIRLDADLTQKEVAARVGESQSYVSKYESGEQRLDLFELERICRAVGMPFRTFIDRYLGD